MIYWVYSTCSTEYSMGPMQFTKPAGDNFEPFTAPPSSVRAAKNATVFNIRPYSKRKRGGGDTKRALPFLLFILAQKVESASHFAPHHHYLECLWREKKKDET